MEAQFITQNSREYIGDKDYPPRYVSVVFGNPRSEECAGFGICRMDEDWDIPGQMPPPRPKPPKDISACLSGCCRGVAVVKRQETAEGDITLSFGFLKSALTPTAINKYFNGAHFRVGSDILLPKTLTAAFDLDPSVLKVGLYQIVETNDYFQIQLPIN